MDLMLEYHLLETEMQSIGVDMSSHSVQMIIQKPPTERVKELDKFLYLYKERAKIVNTQKVKN